MSILIPLILAALIAVGLIMGWASKRSKRRRAWLLAGFLALFMATLFCIYGLLASFEPGVNATWRMGYTAGALIGLTGGVIQLVAFFLD